MDYLTASYPELAEQTFVEHKRNRRKKKTVSHITGGYCFGCDHWITYVGQTCPVCGRNENPNKLKDY